MKTLRTLVIVVLSIIIIACQAPLKKEENNTIKSERMTTDKKILFVVTSHENLGNTNKKTGYWLSEVAHPWKELTQEGYVIDFVSPNGGKAPIDPASMDLKDSINTVFLADKKYQEKIENSLKPSDVDPKNYIGIYYAGGHGTMWDFPNNKLLAKITASIYENGGIVSSACHGTAGLVNVMLPNGKYLVENKNISSFTNEEESEIKLTHVVPFSLEDQLKKHGAKINKSGLWQEQISIDQRLITGQNPQSAKAVGKAIVKVLAK
ncbi:MAG: type 1 glutamine amidotransferase domain-containing protein [Flavobacteriales bacterium]